MLRPSTAHAARACTHSCQHPLRNLMQMREALRAAREGQRTANEKTLSIRDSRRPSTWHADGHHPQHAKQMADSWLIKGGLHSRVTGKHSRAELGARTCLGRNTVRSHWLSARQRSRHCALAAIAIPLLLSCSASDMHVFEI